MLSSRQVDSTLDPAIREIATDAAPCQEVLARARQVLPGLGEARLETVRIGIRSVAADGMPVVGIAPNVDNLYLLVSHSGVTLAPVLGRLVAEELLGGPQDRLDPYRPARFA
jgi:glycine/D-amino acid oxidase-like deaminating enzyme